MEFRTFGGTGIHVIRYCPGAMMFGKMGNTDHDECVQIVHAALDAKDTNAPNPALDDAGQRRR